MAPVVPHIIKFDSIASTNTTLRALVNTGVPEGTVVVAKSQTSGRGRGDRVWSSPEGGLYFSLLLKAPQLNRPTDLALLAGAVMAKTVKQFVSSSQSVGVKWPNDCLLQGKKVGGVLCEALGEGCTAPLIIGVGINVNVASTHLIPFQERPFKATSLLEFSSGQRFDLDLVLQTFLKIFFEKYETYLQRGFGFIQSFWEGECLFLGKQIELKNTGVPQEKMSPTGSIRGTFLGIDEQGAIVVSDGQGQRLRFVTGELICCW